MAHASQQSGSTSLSGTFGFSVAQVEFSAGSGEAGVRLKRDESHWQSRRQQLVRSLLGAGTPPIDLSVAAKGNTRVSELEKVGETTTADAGPKYPPTVRERAEMSWV